MGVSITDCTIRDGGYLLDKNSPPEFIMGIMEGLSKAGIEFVETGFLQDIVEEESLIYRNAKDARRFLPEDRGSTEFLGFCDNSRYSVEHLEPYDGESFRWLRISFAKHESADSLQFCREAQQKGYRVQFNPMDALSYSDEEWTALIKQVNQVSPGAFSIVDTFGAMYLEDFEHFFLMTDQLLKKGIRIGLHSHDNLGLSCALAERMISLAEGSGRDVMVDGSLMGMGRGAGNARTELLAAYLNKRYEKKYNIEILVDLIDNYIAPLRESIIWGYDVPMFICGTKHAHVDNVYYLQNNTDCTNVEKLRVLEHMTEQQRTRYGKGYKKGDFSVLQKAYETIAKRGST